jgi:hypothetical protein
VRERLHGGDDPAFNVALPQGGSYRYTFTKDGIWDVRCDMHQNMAATVVSTSTPYVTVAGPDGAFMIEGVVPGSYDAALVTSSGRSGAEIEVAEGERRTLTFKTLRP